MSPADALAVRPLTPVIGAEIEAVDLTAPLDPETAEALRAALRQHLVLLFREQDLTDEQHLEFARVFGTTNVYPVTAARGLDQPIEWIEDTEASPPKANLWHTDAAFLPEPPDVAVLNMRICPPVGGDTLWLNLYAAYESLSGPMQAAAAGLELDVHPGETFRQSVEMQYGPGIYEKVAAQFGGRRVPLVRIHPETGRPALYLCGAYVRGVTGMHADESEALLTLIRRPLLDPNLQCRWRWHPYDVAVWDERCTNHWAVGDHYPAHRLVRRCTVGGSTPRGPAHPIDQLMAGGAGGAVS